ncbi:sulfurtransferase [Xenorhabdus indica]|nr:sulfurtransferase [Xenorhabdus indica]
MGTVDKAQNAVPNSRKVNGKSLSGDITLNAADVGAFSRGATTFVQGENGVSWDAASGSYIAQRNGDTQLVIHFNVDAGSTPALQLKAMYRNNGIAYRSARDRYGFEEPWTEFYTTKNKPSAADVGAYSKEETDVQINKVDSQFNQFNQFKTNIQGYIPLPLNLFSNSMMRSVEPEGHPTNYTAIGCTIQAVHPWTKGFEGPYTEVAPPNVAPDPDSANENNPYWYGKYYLGARMGRGGLGSGWGGIDSGKILKITSTTESSGHKFFRIPVETYGVFEQLGLRFWVKIVKGKLGMGVDSGYNEGEYRPLGGYVIEKAEADSAQDGWLFVDKLIDISRVTTVQGNVLNFGLPYDEDCEIYLALPYLYVPMANKSMIVAAGETSISPVFTPGKKS